MKGVGHETLRLKSMNCDQARIQVDEPIRSSGVRGTLVSNHGCWRRKVRRCDLLFRTFALWLGAFRAPQVRIYVLPQK